MATSDRPVSSESVCSLSSFQNGDIEFNQVSTSERRLGNESGSPRCISSYRHSPSTTSLSSLCFQRQGLSVPLSFSPRCQSVCVYSDVKNSTQAREAPRYSGSRLPGRLVTTFCLRNPVMASQQKASEDYSGPRLYSQLREVRTSSSPGFLFPGGQIQAGSSSYPPFTGQHCLYSTGSSQVSGSQTSLSTSIILHSRSNGVNGQSSTTLESFQEISSVGTQREVVSKACLVGHQYSSRTVVCLGSRSMDGFGLSDIHVAPSSSFSSTPSLRRFELGGLGAHMDNHMTSGFWSITYKKQHINVLEMKAVLLVLQAFAVHIKGHSVLLATDNTTVAAYINKQGGLIPVPCAT